MAAPTGPNNRSNIYYERKNHVKIARVDSNRTEFFGTIGGVPDIPTETDFLFTVRTTSSGETFTIPMQDIGVVDATIQSDTAAPPHNAGATISAFNDANLVLTFPRSGDHQIRISKGASGGFTNIHFNNGGDKDKVISIENLGAVGWLSFRYAFRGCINMVAADVTGDTSSVTDAFSAFQNCGAAVFSGLASWDTSLFTTFNGLFRNCAAQDLEIDDWIITGINVTGGLTNFIQNGQLPTARYDAVLNKWEAQAVFDGLTPDFGTSQYSGTGAAARQRLIDDHSWVITDGGVDPAALGPELWSDPPSSIGTGWTDDGGGSYSCDGTNFATLGDGGKTFSAGEFVYVTYDVTNYVSGSVRAEVQGGGVDTGVLHSANGSYVDQIEVTDNARTTIRFLSSGGGFNGTLSAVSFKKINPL